MYSEVKIVYKTINEVSNVSQAMKLINFEKKNANIKIQTAGNIGKGKKISLFEKSVI